MDVISSFFQNVKDKLSNPFFGTLIFILIFHHWDFWYAIINFDENVNLRQKLKYLREVAGNEFCLGNLLIDLIFAAFFTVVGYSIVVGTRALSLWIEHNLMTNITKRIIDKKTILRDVYESVEKERDEYSEKYEEQRRTVRVMSKNHDEQTTQITEKDKILLERNQTINDLQVSQTALNDSLTKEQLDHQKTKISEAQLKAQIKEAHDRNENNHKQIVFLENYINSYKFIMLSDQAKNYYISIDKFPPIILEKAGSLQLDSKWNAFLAVANYIKNGGTISGDVLNEMIEYDVVIYDSNGIEKLTPIGEILFIYQNLFKDMIKGINDL